MSTAMKKQRLTGRMSVHEEDVCGMKWNLWRRISEGMERANPGGKDWIENFAGLDERRKLALGLIVKLTG